MIKTKKCRKTFDEIVSVICDKCGKEYEAENYVEIDEFLRINFTGGYGSVFGDMTVVKCDICQHCLLEMIGDICRRED